MARAGLKKVVDFQDVAYGGEYLDILKTLHAADRSAGGGAAGLCLHGGRGKIPRQRHDL